MSAYGIAESSSMRLTLILGTRIAYFGADPCHNFAVSIASRFDCRLSQSPWTRSMGACSVFEET